MGIARTVAGELQDTQAAVKAGAKGPLLRNNQKTMVLLKPNSQFITNISLVLDRFIPQQSSPCSHYGPFNNLHKKQPGPLLWPLAIYNFVILPCSQQASDLD